MRKPKILVTGAAGKTGMPTALQLLQKGYRVRALVRRIDERSRRLERAGAEIAVGSLEDPVDVRASMKDVTRAYFCPPFEPGTLRRATVFAVAAVEARLEVAVVLSQWLVDATHPSLRPGRNGCPARCSGGFQGSTSSPSIRAGSPTTTWRSWRAFRNSA